jgi:hypothetical protein
VLLCGMLVLTRFDRSMLYVDADARMEVYEDKEGNKKSNLSLVASTYPRRSTQRNGEIRLTHAPGTFEVLSRPRIEEFPETDDEGRIQEGSS